MRKRALGLAVALIVGAFVVSASGAATTQAQKATTINVSTRSAVVHYLRSIHVNAKHAVIQRGLRNYAGAHCPGAHWTCASTKHTVVQIAKRGGQNRFVCRSSKCVVVQFSGTAHGVYMAGRAAASPSKSGGNSGYCVKTGSGTLSGGGQTCSVTQSGSGGNTAGIYEVTSKVSGLVQTVQFAASISQQGSGDNIACVTQGISQTGSTSNTNGKPVNVDLESTQSISILQDTATGNNFAINGAQPTTGQCDNSQTLSQSQNQTSIVTATGNITQYENQFTGQGLTAGNVSLDIEQNQGKTPNSTLQKGQAIGTNSANFSQTTTQTAVANTVSGKSVTQQQNAPDGDGVNSAFSGLVGTVNQDSKGKSTATVAQNETQCEDAANTSNGPAVAACSQTADPVPGITLNQMQNGPVGLFTSAKSSGRVPFAHKGVGTSSQTSAVGVADKFNLTQISSQYADKPGPTTTVQQVNTMQGDCASSGNGSATGGTCTASQSATLNGGNGNGNTNDGYTAGSIGQLLIKCDNGHNSCKPTPPPDPTLTVLEPTVDTNGNTTDPNASFEFTDPATDSTFNCTLDNNPTVTPCGSASVNNANLLDGTQTYGPLPVGTHTFTVTATDGSGNTSGSATFTWTVLPYLSFEASSDGTSGWSAGPGSPIDLTTGSDIPNTFAQITLHNFEGVPLSDLVNSPSFITDNYAAGSPRFVIDLSNHDYLFGNPPNSGLNGSDFAWEIHHADHSFAIPPYNSWSTVLTYEAGTTVTDAYVVADGDQPSTTDVITGLTFDGYSFN